MLSSRFNRRRLLAGASVIAAIPFAPSVDAQEGTPVPDQPTLPQLPPAEPRADGPIKVVASTPILADIVRQIGGERVDVDSILPAGADAHDFEPAPEDIVSIEEAALVVEHGLNLDSWAADLVDEAGDKQTVVATDGVTVIPSGDDGSAPDPHVWFDPANVKVMASNIAVALSNVDPDGAPYYEARRDAFHTQLDALDQWIAAQIATIPAEQRKLVTNHDAFRYYIDRYGFTFVGSVIPSIDSRAEPSANETAELIERIEAEHVPAIFTETSINPELERELAEQAGVTVVPGLYSDSLGEEGTGAETYIGMMIANTMLIVNALRTPV
jgi:ABC-type Zn uptake system ZnuABC Zn-binding protein ZnuA